MKPKIPASGSSTSRRRSATSCGRPEPRGSSSARRTSTASTASAACSSSRTAFSAGPLPNRAVRPERITNLAPSMPRRSAARSGESLPKWHLSARLQRAAPAGRLREPAHHLDELSTSPRRRSPARCARQVHSRRLSVRRHPPMPSIHSGPSCSPRIQLFKDDLRSTNLTARRRSRSWRSHPKSSAAVRPMPRSRFAILRADRRHDDHGELVQGYPAQDSATSSPRRSGSRRSQKGRSARLPVLVLLRRRRT